MAKYKVRSGFVAHVKDEDGTTHAYAEGKVIDLTDEQFQLHAHQVEAYEPPKKEKEPVT